MGIAVRDEGSKVNSNINVTPMVDVMLVLLIIFMVITPMLQNKVNVDLAQVRAPQDMPDASKEDAVTVAVTRDGQVYLGSEQVTIDSLGAKVRDKVENRTNKTVYFRADARSRYGVFEDAVDSVRTAGVDTIALLTERTSTTPPPPPQPGGE